MKIYCLKKLDGGCAIMRLYPLASKDGGYHTPEEQVAKWPGSERALYPDPLEYREITEADVLTDRTFRDQWAMFDGKPGVDMAKARASWKQRIRDARDQKLGVMDGQTRRLEGLVRLGKASDADLTSHEQEKQALRDLPNGTDGTDVRCDAAQTPDELKEIWPDAIS